jgi:hypothetical protein
MVLDVDFVPNPGALGYLNSVRQIIVENPKVAFVVPAFEMDKEEEARGLPNTKQELVALYTKGTLRQVRILDNYCAY